MITADCVVQNEFVLCILRKLVRVRPSEFVHPLCECAQPHCTANKVYGEYAVVLVRAEDSLRASIQ